MHPFRFKQFSVAHDRCAMKIGTDGILLGAWTSLKNRPNSILDIGAGSGIIALQLAQRSEAEIIDALEIDADAFEQCVDNFENSPWGDRLFCYHASFQEFVEEMNNSYDLIVSNPPFHDASFPSDAVSKENNSISNARKIARTNSSLPFSELLRGISRLLTETGIFSVILPKKNEGYFVGLASAENLYLQKRTEVKGNPNSSIKRSLLQFGFEKTAMESNVLVIEKMRHEYTEDYIDIVKDFYLKM